MKIVSANVNGGYFDVESANVVCLQEVKKCCNYRGKYSYYNAGKQHHGVAIFSDTEATRVEKDFIKTLLPEQRSILIELPDGTTIINVYVPSTSGKRIVGGRPIMELKVEFLNELSEYIKRYSGRKLVLVGDFNTCLNNYDSYYYNRNREGLLIERSDKRSICPSLNKLAACHPDERRAFIDLIESNNLTDTYESKNQHVRYTWWNERYGLDNYSKGIGLRLDYIFTNFKVDNAYMLEKKDSDHCPVCVEVRE